MRFGLHEIAEMMKIYSYLHVVKNRPQYDSYRPDNFKFLYSRISFTELERCRIIKYSVYHTVPLMT
jgi:hypothetical protein